MGGAEQLDLMCCSPLKLRCPGRCAGRNAKQGARHEAADSGAALGCSFLICYSSLQVLVCCSGEMHCCYESASKKMLAICCVWRGIQNRCPPLRLLTAWWALTLYMYVT